MIKHIIMKGSINRNFSPPLTFPLPLFKEFITLGFMQLSLRPFALFYLCTNPLHLCLSSIHTLNALFSISVLLFSLFLPSVTLSLPSCRTISDQTFHSLCRLVSLLVHFGLLRFTFPHPSLFNHLFILFSLESNFL